MRLVERRGYALFVLAAVYALSVLDRQIVAILLQPIKLELRLTDTQLGFLSGIAFAIFYTLLGLPLARVADTHSRRRLIAVSLAIFSIMTALCGVVGSFGQLLLLRICVGVGEAGTTPASTSMIADLYSERSRGIAMALFTIGGITGSFLGFAAGGVIAHLLGWRATFMLVGVPGVILAFLVAATLQDAQRRYPEQHVSEANVPRTVEVLQFLWRQRAFRHLTCGMALVLFSGYAFQTWLPAYFQRSYGMSILQTGLAMGSLIGGFSAAGILASGLLSDRLMTADIRWQSWIVAVSAVVMLPFYIATLLVHDSRVAFAAYAIPALLGAFYQAPSLALVQGLAPPQMRATAIAVVLFVANIVGIGMGPQLVGIVSDHLQSHMGAESLRYSLLISTAVLPWAAAHFYRAAKYLAGDIARARDASRPHLQSEAERASICEPAGGAAVRGR